MGSWGINFNANVSWVPVSPFNPCGLTGPLRELPQMAKYVKRSLNSAFRAAKRKTPA